MNVGLAMKQGSIHSEFAGQDVIGVKVIPGSKARVEIEEDEAESLPEICCHTLIAGSVKACWSWGE